MVVDTSVFVAVVLGEPDAEHHLQRMIAAGALHTSAVSYVESSTVVQARQGTAATADLDTLLTRLDVEVEPVDAPQARLAFAAWRRFGKGRHPAGLNLGDCFPYALAKSRGEQLLFKGEDFGQTDIAIA